MKIIMPIVLLAAVAFAQDETFEGDPINLDKQPLSVQVTVSHVIAMRQLERLMNHINHPKIALFTKAVMNKISEDGAIPTHMLRFLVEALEKEEVNVERSLNCNNGTCAVPMGLSGIWQYGCWCYMGDYLMEGKGPTVNAHDEVCQSMQHCMRCAVMDDNTCDPTTAIYVVTVDFTQSGQPGGMFTCDGNGNDECSARVCTCEANLLNNIFALTFGNITYDPSWKHISEGGTFDPASCTDGNGGGNSGDKDYTCCGQYPLRFPYRVGNRQCCENASALFNPLDHHCCDDTVQEISDPCV